MITIIKKKQNTFHTHSPCCQNLIVMILIAVCASAARARGLKGMQFPESENAGLTWPAAASG
jgi:hypothetical protein